MVLVLIPGLHLEKDASIGLHPEKRIISVQDPSQGPGGKCHVTGFYLWSVWEEGADLHSVVAGHLFCFLPLQNRLHCQFLCTYKTYEGIQLLFYPHCGTEKLFSTGLNFWHPLFFPHLIVEIQIYFTVIKFIPYKKN